MYFQRECKRELRKKSIFSNRHSKRPNPLKNLVYARTVGYLLTGGMRRNLSTLQKPC